ncbi:Amt family ammonium transporter [Acinetobacter calcoaceticus]|uniref:Amt family ammonium transporter n=1 Tax=Acinetobacter calcoaceticus TaxID=471 RepID=A0A4R1XSD0_ACICA|nr:Amt family ammonium transporter [Acinetobacter calcoaceticus]
MGVLRFLLVILMVAISSMTLAATGWSDNDVRALNVAPDFTLLLLGGLFVMLMQAGFAIIEGGYDPESKTFSIFLINYLAAFVGNILYSFALFLFCFLFGDHLHQFGLPFQSWQWHFFIFYMLMATTVTMVVSRIIPRNISLLQYWWIALFISGVIFSALSRWVWGQGNEIEGFLRNLGFIDFAGATVVHSTAAWIVLAGYWVLGQEQQELIRRKDVMFSDYKLLSMALAGFILWLAWSGLNIGYISAQRIDIQDVVINTIAALSGAVIMVIALGIMTKQKISFEKLIKAALGGLVAITGCGGMVSMSSSLWIGAVAGLMVFILIEQLKRWITAKNIVDVLVIHGLCGVWGTLAVVFADRSTIVDRQQVSLLTQGLGVLVTFVWSMGLAIVLFKLVHWYGVKMNPPIQNKR